MRPGNLKRGDCRLFRVGYQPREVLTWAQSLVPTMEAMASVLAIKGIPGIITGVEDRPKSQVLGRSPNCLAVEQGRVPGRAAKQRPIRLDIGKIRCGQARRSPARRSR